MAAHPYESLLTTGDTSLGEARRLRGAALMTMLLVLVLVAAAVLATAEWMAPATAGGVPG